MGTIKKGQAIFQIKVTLLETDPPIWRRLLVPGEVTLWQLHNILQLAMEWGDYHLHDFRIDQQRYGIPEQIENDFSSSNIRDERTTRLSRVMCEIGARAVYTYDFGDNWRLEILLEKRLEPEPGKVYPACLEGGLHAPPEDSGGVGAFHDLLEASNDPSHEEHEEIRGWLGSEFDPEAFSVEEVNRRLAPLERRRFKNANR